MPVLALVPEVDFNPVHPLHPAPVPLALPGPSLLPSGGSSHEGRGPRWQEHTCTWPHAPCSSSEPTHPTEDPVRARPGAAPH